MTAVTVGYAVADAGDIDTGTREAAGVHIRSTDVVITPARNKQMICTVYCLGKSE